MAKDILDSCPKCGEEPDIVIDAPASMTVRKEPDDIERICSDFNYVWFNDHKLELRHFELYIHL